MAKSTCHRVSYAPMNTTAQKPAARRQWTLPEGHRANLCAHLWTFPLFFSNRDKIDALNAPHLDPLFALLALIPQHQNEWPEGEDNDARVARSHWYQATPTVEAILSFAIVEAFGWPQLDTCYAGPSELLRRFPIETPQTPEDALLIAADLCAYRGDETGPWRGILFDYGIVAHCWQGSAALNCWTSLRNYPRPGLVDWRRQPEDSTVSWGHDMRARPLECLRVILS